MRIEQREWNPKRGWTQKTAALPMNAAGLVLMFGTRDLLVHSPAVQQIQADFPQAQIVGCSTAGTIYDTNISDENLAVTAVAFNHTRVKVVESPVVSATDSEVCGDRLAADLSGDDLVHVLVLSDGLNINGAALVRGLCGRLGPAVAVTGGLSGDGAAFVKTSVYLNGTCCDHRVVAIGFYGKSLRVGYGSVGGWDVFGPERIVTRSEGNVLYELDGEPALDLYKRYLGHYAQSLPASGLRFPLSIGASGSTPVVRTILAVSEQDKSLTYAGDVPQGIQARLMRANFDRLIDGATSAARETQRGMNGATCELAVLVSCVGRKLVLQQRTEQELDCVREVLGTNAAMTGFYSYGEIAPFEQSTRCELHNQTMTITAFSEAA